jgi:hypothetical protein
LYASCRCMQIQPEEGVLPSLYTSCWRKSVDRSQVLCWHIWFGHQSVGDRWSKECLWYHNIHKMQWWTGWRTEVHNHWWLWEEVWVRSVKSRVIEGDLQNLVM